MTSTATIRITLAALAVTAVACRDAEPGAPLGGPDSGSITGAKDAQPPVNLGAGPVDLGGVGVDLGLPSPDTGAGATDTGVGNTDLGLTTDFGAPGSDVGVADAGVPDTGVVGPDGGPADAGGPPTGFDPTLRAASLAQALCANRTRCSPAIYAFEGSDEATCIQEETLEFNAFFGAVGTAIAGGAVRFDEATFNRCINAYGSAQCSLGVDQVADCGYLVGLRPEGQPCAFNTECGGGLFCDRASLGSCGVCRAEAAQNESCATLPCADNLACATVGQDSICVPGNAAAGAACGTVPTGFCAGRLSCVGGVCMAPAAAGAPCATDGMSNANCDIFMNQVCSNGACAATSWNPPGQSCAGTNRCDGSGGCNPQTMTCDALPAAGQPCANGRCGDGSFCDGAATCQARVGPGAACSSSVECLDPYDCVGAPGAQVCQLLSWMSCGGGGADAGVGADTGTAMDAGAVMDAGAAMDAGTPMDAGAVPGFDPAARAAELSTALCRYTTRCEPARHEFAARTEAACITQQTGLIGAQFSATASILAAGRATFDENAFNACRDAQATADCDLGPGPCDYIDGSQQIGDACSFNTECADGLYCEAAGVAICGACQPRTALGADCRNAPCQTGAGCVEVGQGSGNFTCVPTNVGEGGACGTVPTGLCRGVLQCVADVAGNRTCVRPAARGAACATDGQVTADCNILQGNGCVNAACAALRFVGVGSTCDDTTLCNVASLCEQGACVARPASGPCANGRCAPDTFCDANAMCVADLTTGAACTASAQCAGALSCTGPTGNRTCNTLTWAMCP